MAEPMREENGKFPTYAWPGGYTIIYIMTDNEVLCPDCANLPEAYTTREKREAIRSGHDQDEGTPDYTDRQWEIVAVDTYDEGLPLTCANCNKEIPSSYGPTENDYRDMVLDWWRQKTGDVPRGTDLVEVVDYVMSNDKEEEGNYHVVGNLVEKYFDELDKEPSGEWPAGRRQQKINNPISYECNQFGHYLVTDDHGHELYIQIDYDFPALAETFGWNGKLVSKSKLRVVNIKDNDKAGAEIYSAIVWLDDHEGKVVEDPGYFFYEEG